MKWLLQRRPLSVPMHDTLVNWAFAFLLGSIVLDLVAWFQVGVRDTTGVNVAAYAVLIAAAVAIVLAILSALADTLDLPDDIRRTGWGYSGLIALIALLIIGNLALRNFALRDQVVPPLPLFMSLTALVLTGVAAWLGGLISVREIELEVEEELEEPEPIRRRRRR